MQGWLRHTAVLAMVLLASLPVYACPVCDSGTGQQVRASIFDSGFGYNLLVTLLPFPILLGIALVIYYGLPKRRISAPRPRTNRSVNSPQDS